MTAADRLLDKALASLGISLDAPPSERFANIYELVVALKTENDKETIAVNTTGTITDRICGWALETACPSSFYRLTGVNTKWLGDYALLGFPLNLIVSVKSFKAKERLLMSGSGSQLVPTIGFGLFDDPAEFSAERLVSYRMRGFLAIYMPKPTRDALSESARNTKNWNGTTLVRNIEDFPRDLRAATLKVELGDQRRDFIDPLRI